MGVPRIAILIVAALSSSAWAQTPNQEQDVDAYAKPAEVGVGMAKAGQVYTDAHGLTLYALDGRLARARSGTVALYCVALCEKSWAPLKATAGEPAVGFWKVIQGVEGPQWSYRNNPVFTYRTDITGTVRGDGYDDIFSIMAYVPPAPQLLAPASISVKFVAGAYIMVDAGGHALFTGKASASWTPLVAGTAAVKRVGDWAVTSTAQPQWMYRGNPVFVSDTTDPAQIPVGASVLHP